MLSKNNHPSIKSFTLVRLILAAAILLAAFVVAPQTVQAAGQPARPAPGTIQLAAAFIKSDLHIYGINLPAQRAFTVRIKTRATDPWLVVGKVKSNAKGTVNAAFEMRIRSDRPVDVKVCLKDKATGLSYCTIARWSGK